MDDPDCSSPEYELSQRLTAVTFPADHEENKTSPDEEINEEDEFELQRRENEKHNLCKCSILQLPHEILALFFRYVATKDLDIRSVESLGECCSHFYLLARDPALWRAVCQRVWGENVSKKNFTSWRSVYIEKPHVWVSGVYISRNSYVRNGDPGSLSAHYRPYYIVEYCRYLKFCPNGQVFMLTTPNDPVKVVQKMANSKPKIKGLLVGSYTVHSEQKSKRSRTAIVSCTLNLVNTTKEYIRNKARSENTSESQYFLDLEIGSTSNVRHFNKLSWLHHSCTTTHLKNGSTNTANFNVSQNYPPLYFSPVRSYTNISNSCL